MLSFILFFGLSQVIEAVTTIAFGTSERSIPGDQLGSAVAAVAGFFAGHKVDAGPVELFGQTFPASWVASGVASGCAVLLVYVYLYRTRLGYFTRAVMDNRDEAIATGINVHRVSAVAFGIGLGLAAAAGVFAPFMLGSITPAMGAEVTVTSFAVIVIGSLGNPLGTVLGGISLRHLLHVHAELLQLLGQSPALRSAHRDPAGAAQRPARTAGAQCLKFCATCC